MSFREVHYDTTTACSKRTMAVGILGRDLLLTMATLYICQYDLFKHTLLRYFGYANELGESFRPLIHHRWVAASYGVAGTYVLAGIDMRCKI